MKVKQFCLPLLYLLSINAAAQDTITIPLQAFDRVAIVGKLDVQIEAGQRQSELQISAAKTQLANIKVKTVNGQLTITQLGCCQNSAIPRLHLLASTLSSLNVQGDNQVSVSHLHSQNFELYASNHGNIDLQGVVSLTKLKAQGSGTIAIYWLNSPDLTLISGGKTTVLLGGIVTTLHAYVTENSSVNARYLKLANAYITAQDFARLDVAASDILNAQAIGQSSVYYYQQPKALHPFMFNAGAVIDVVGEKLLT
jgi:hypothetical protein